MTRRLVVVNNPAPRYFVGIDPGVNGGVAVLDRQGKVIAAHRMPATPSALVDLLRWVPTPASVLIEFVRSRPRMASASVFTFGRGFGRIEGAVAAADLPSRFITPKVWQGYMQCLSGGDKNVTKQRAVELFPCVTVTHATADALLIAECCRRLEAGVRPSTRATR